VQQRVAKARPLVEEIRRAATRNQEFLRDLDMPLDIFEAGYGRIMALARVREALDRLYPHQLPAAQGTRLLKAAAEEMPKHIEQCARLRDRIEETRLTRGSPRQDVLNLDQQIKELKTLLSYVSYHAAAYAEGVPLPAHELWSL
jgi:hypothetical protein